MSTKPHIARVRAEEDLIGALAALEASDTGVSPSRARAIATLRRDGLPHRRVEAWRYTDLKASLAGFAPAAPVEIDRPVDIAAHDLLGGLERHRLVIVDGRFRADLSDGDGIEGLSIAHHDDRQGTPSTPADDDTAVALNHAFGETRLALSIAAGATITPLVEIAHIVSAQAACSVAPRVSIDVGAGATARVMETFTSPQEIAHQIFPLIQLDVAADARFNLIRAQHEGRSALHLNTLYATIAERGTLDIFTLNLGAAIARTSLWIDINGADTHVALRGINLIGGTRHTDTSLQVHHTRPRCTSEELFKSVVADQATGVFQGKISVDPIAQKTDGMMMAQALLLSQTATFNSKPELEIYADDVRCTHGATCGAIDDDLLFYLMARGIDRNEAESLLVRAFVGEVMDNLDAPIRDALWIGISAWLDAHRSQREKRP